ncbi:MAG: TlpA family protein disulfide reductase, partial [Cytophagales bacterium]|nr:TlpA family protein disulfide reductase [Cytophagales bacterium]
QRQKYWDAYDHAAFDYRLRMAMLNKSSLMPEEKSKKSKEYYLNYSSNIKRLIKASGSSFMALVLASKLDTEQDFALLDSLAKEFTSTSPGSSYTVNFRKSLDRIRCTIVGQPVCEISLTDNKGVLSNLSDLRGKYVLLDFWASWCVPCRKENPELVKVYNKYNSKGFEIYSVSIDEVKEAWLGAIEEDKLTWKQVSDLKGWEGTTAVQYNLEAIPSNFLLDKEGKILYKNLDAKQLDLLLAKVIK